MIREKKNRKKIIKRKKKTNHEWEKEAEGPLSLCNNLAQIIYLFIFSAKRLVREPSSYQEPPLVHTLNHA